MSQNNYQEKNQQLEVFPQKVYYISSKEDPTVLVAINVVKQGENIMWFDTVKDRSMAIKNVLNSDYNNFSFIRKELPFIYTLEPMNLEIYENKVKNKLINPSSFSDLESLNKAFLSTLKNN